MDRFKPAKSLRQAMWFPLAPHDPPHQFVHIIGDIFQGRGATGCGQVMKLTQLLTLVAIQHVQNTLNA
jgi:hypothetical protein